MLNLTAEAKQAWLAQTRQVNARVTIGTAVYNADKIMSIEYDSGSISGETFQIGSFYQNSIKVVLVGILESLATDNKVRLEFAVKVGQAFEWVNMGTFYVAELDRDRNSNRTTFTAVDASVYLGKNYAPTISFPNSLKNLVTDIANQCGVQVNFASMTHLADVNVTQPPSKYTCRQVISMVAQIHGGFARINRNDQLEVTRLMSSDIELSPSHYLLKGLTKNETTYRTDGIIVKIGENEEDVLKVGTTTGSAVINLENPLMTQTLLNEMWRVVSIISYYPFNLKWRGIPNLEAGDWITIVDKQGTRYRVPNLSYKLSFKGGLSAESSANTTATSNVQHKLRGTLTQRVEDVEGYINATGGRSYTGLDVPDNKYLKKGDTWYKPDGDDTAILVYDGEKWEEVASPEVFRQLQADFEALDKQAQEAFEQVDTLVQESPETKRLAQEAQEAVNLANKEITKLQTNVNDTKTALQNAEQEFADSLETTTRELTAKISGIDVGGRNILRGTKDMMLGSGTWESGTWRKSNTGTFRNVTLTDFPLSNITQGIEITSDNSECGIAQDYLKLESGEYTLSYYVKAETPNTLVRIQAFWNTNYYANKDYTLNDTNWTRISITGKLPENQNTMSAGYIYVETPNATITVAAPFEHRSNKEGEWNQAPEDFQSDLSNTSIELSTKITESAAKLRTEMSEKYSTKNDLTTLQGDYDSFKEQTAQKISQQVSSIQTIQTDTTNAKQLANDAYSKANSAVTSATNASSTANSAMSKASDATSVANSASQNATNAVASANSAVSTANTAKSNADKAIADVASLTKTVSSQSTRIDQTSSRIDQVASGVTEIGGRLDGMSIGNENLINLSEIAEYNGATIDKSNYVKRGEVILTTSTSTLSGLYFDFYNDSKPETYYVFSYDITALGSQPFNTIRGHMDAGFYTIKFYVDGVDTKIGYPSTYTFSDSSVRKHHVEVYVKLKDEMTNNRRIFIQPNHMTPASEKYKIENLKIVEGNKYTNGWSPAPSDIKSEIDDTNNNLSNNYYAKTTVDSKLSTAVSGITAQYTKDISTKLNNYYDKNTMDRKLTIGDIGIETYVKNTQNQLSSLQFSGRNYVLDSDKYIETTTGDTMRNFDLSADILKARNKTFTVSIDIELENAVFRRVGFEPSLIFSNGNESWYGTWLYYSGKPMTLKTRIYQTWAIADSDVTRYAQHGIYIQGFVSGRIKIGRPAMIEGNGQVWSPAPEDMATLTQYTEVKQLADRISSTVYDSASGLVTKTNQLAGKYAITNLNSYGDVLSSLNLNGGNVRIKGELIDLDGNVRIQDGFVNKLKANSILAKEITAQATTVVNAKIANLDAGIITTGILKGTNLSLNLGTGEVQFQKGRIQAPNNTLDIQVNTGIMKVLNTNGEGMTLQNGNLYFSGWWNKEYGSIEYSGLLDNGRDGIMVTGYNGCVMGTKSQRDTWLSGVYKPIADGGSFWVNEFENLGYAGILAKTGISFKVNALVKSPIEAYTGIDIRNSSGTGEITTNSHNTKMYAQERFEINAKDIYLNGNVRSISGLVTADANYKLTFVFVPGGQSYFIVDTGIVSGKYRFNVTQI